MLRKVTWKQGGKEHKAICHAIGSDIDGPWILIEFEDGCLELQRITEYSNYKLMRNLDVCTR